MLTTLPARPLCRCITGGVPARTRCCTPCMGLGFGLQVMAWSCPVLPVVSFACIALCMPALQAQKVCHLQDIVWWQLGTNITVYQRGSVSVAAHNGILRCRAVCDVRVEAQGMLVCVSGAGTKAWISRWFRRCTSRACMGQLLGSVLGQPLWLDITWCLQGQCVTSTYRGAYKSRGRCETSCGRSRSWLAVLKHALRWA